MCSSTASSPFFSSRSSSSRQIVNLHSNTRRLRSQLLRFASPCPHISSTRGSNSVVTFIYLPRGLILPPRTSPQVNVDTVPCRLFCKSVTMAWWKTERMISSDAVLRSTYVSPIFSLSYEIIRRVATLDAMEKRLAISTVIASAAASGGAIVVKEFIGRFEKRRKKKNAKEVDVEEFKCLVLTLAVVEFLNARYGVEALVTGDEDENVRKFTT
ncbi:hypothetical protein HID58_053967 [Brassica napus]|uniref:Uncharacterized protein n=1 Tax=Brassica napus TaxID=3708 RepID=A0ABQ8AGK4_BRANA|nr:hypothetical protein HID58_053967 [Brassica napus]